MADNYTQIIENNLSALYNNLPEKLAEFLPGKQNENLFEFMAFGEKCQISPKGIMLGNEKQTGAPGIIISLYALHAGSHAVILKPLKAFKEFPDTMPYVGAFTSHTEQILIPHVRQIETAQKKIIKYLQGTETCAAESGDFSFFVTPLPKITLCYIFYNADEDFPPSATCLYSNNASLFLPPDALADVGEYTSKKIIELL